MTVSLPDPVAFPRCQPGAAGPHPVCVKEARRLRPALPEPEVLHPALWRAHQLGRGSEHAVPSGHPALDAQLPGGGWPRRMLTELLLPHPGIGEFRLLAPSLVATLRAGRLVMLFDPPECLSGWALLQLGIDAEQLLVVYTRRAPQVSAPQDGLRGADSHVEAGPRGERGDGLWALEQALKSGHVGALLAWLPPRLPPERLRRLQLAAQAHDGPAFMLREASARERPSAAPLRLALHSAGADRLALRLLKRRGPRLERPIVLELTPVLAAPVAAVHAARMAQAATARAAALASAA
jgi:protein ImuA